MASHGEKSALPGNAARGVLAAVGAAFLFGVSTPLAKLLLHDVGPWMLAALLYAGSGMGLMLWRALTRAAPARLARAELGWLVGANIAGGVVAPVLLMLGLRALPASTTALLLNAEGAFTALVAWCVFRENAGPRMVLGMTAVLAGVAVLGWPADGAVFDVHDGWPACAVLGACAGWAIDNNLTRKVALVDATWLAAVKGVTAGAVNLCLALLVEGHAPDAALAGAALLLGFVAYGVSLALFVLALRELGTARTGAWFALAPFCGAGLAVALGDPVTPALLVAAALMIGGLWLHLTEHHAHAHTHEALGHAHVHEHDRHHEHAHDEPVAPGVRHFHWHRHVALTHRHPHYPDAHHRHEH